MNISKFLEIFSRLLTLLLVIPVHEAAHGLMAKWLGDDTAERQGRITLNPFAHLDPIGIILMLLTGFGWAKPVNVNPLRMKKYRAGFALTALAGPVSNLLAAFVAGLVYNILLATEAGLNAMVSASISPLYCLMLILNFLFSINIGLAIFNLIPVPPLDGFNILRYFTSERVDRWFYMHQREISIIFLILIFVVDIPLGFLTTKVGDLLWNAVDWIPAMRWGW